MVSCIPGELIPCAFVWHDPGITPCCRSLQLKQRGCCLDLSERFSPSALCRAVTLDQTALTHDIG
jgi:hypothetical protein